MNQETLTCEEKLKAIQREARKCKKCLKELTAVVTACLDSLDYVMQGPSTAARGKQISQVANVLDYANDQARHFGLGVPLRKLHPKKATS